MIIRKEEQGYTAEYIAEAIKTATTLEEIVYLQYNIEETPRTLVTLVMS